MDSTPWMVKAKRHVASLTWNRPRPEDPLLYRDLSATVLHRLDAWLGHLPGLRQDALMHWYRDSDCDPGGRQLGSTRAMLALLTDIGERLGPKPSRLARVALRRFDDGLEQLDLLGYSIEYRATALPAVPDERAIKAAYQFDIARGVLRRMKLYPGDVTAEVPRGHERELGQP